VVRERDGRRVWQTALARKLLAEHFGGDDTLTPPEVIAWVARESLRRRAGAAPQTLTVARGRRRLTFALHEMHEEGAGPSGAPDAAGSADDATTDSAGVEWLVVMRESDDAAVVEAVMHAFRLTAREAEVLYWVVKGKTNRDIGDILGTSPRTVTKHLEHVFEKLGVETRTAAASMALQRVRELARS
jgi:DNA-binding CsgD family transcriptional regulator